MNDILTNYDITDICMQLGIKLNGIYMRDKLNNKNFYDGNYIFNLDKSGNGGTHWVASYNADNDNIFYYDSYGFYPPENIYNTMLKEKENIFVNMRQQQPLDSNRCGYYCILFLVYMNNTRIKEPFKRFTKFLEIFDYDNLDNNDEVKDIILNKIKK